jgi:4-amino-4-deoxy-L-arabinose transferase-like glycosyltransferase
LLTVLLLFISENKKILLLFLAAGVSTGLGVLTRSAFFVLVPSVFLWMLLRNRKYLCRRFLVYSSGVLLVIAPWVMRNYKVHETFVLTSTEGGIVCYIANNEKSIYQPSGYWDPSGKHDEPIINEIKGLSEIQIDRYFYRAALRFIKGNSATYRSLVWGRFARFWRLAPHTFSGPGESYKSYHVKIALLTNIPIFFLAGIGFFFSLKRWRDFFLFYLLIVFWSVPVILFFKTIIRYREPLMPFIIILAFVAMNKWFNIGKRGVQ